MSVLCCFDNPRTTAGDGSILAGVCETHQVAGTANFRRLGPCDSVSDLRTTTKLGTPEARNSLTCLLRFIPAHLPNTSALLDKLRETNVEDTCVMESFDVTSLYTNVSKGDAMQAVHEILVEHEVQLALFGLNIAQIMVLIDERLQCNIFNGPNSTTGRNTFQTRWYRKPSNKNIIVHYRSAHPDSTKRAIVRNMFQTAALVSSNSEFKSSSREIASRIALSNGYVAHNMPKGRQPRAPARIHRAQLRGQIAFTVPFISDALSAQVRECVRKTDLGGIVRVVEVPPANLKAQLVRNRLYDCDCETPSCVVCPFGKEGDCRVSGTVYLITCIECKEEYVGETGRPLWVRVKEHVDGLNRCKVSTPLGEHRLRGHSGAVVGVAVTILAREVDIAARKALEALWIAFKNPAINRKEERVAIAQELAPFADL
ncbi:unnamed protein product [Heligmosomoides polygyrus]|uniref:GIY-YIG domain-containing protein n=1 Tax=Heligmosomoides polygyrus TaxID=6339 RepID=A0A3P8EK97_HELPZ|nr:unnamed protein product [Heligmosomoides polygyrus]